jgi:hypothetical protein
MLFFGAKEADFTSMITIKLGDHVHCYCVEFGNADVLWYPASKTMHVATRDPSLRLAPFTVTLSTAIDSVFADHLAAAKIRRNGANTN